MQRNHHPHPAALVLSLGLSLAACGNDADCPQVDAGRTDSGRDGGRDSGPAVQRRELDLDDPEDAALAFLLTRGTTDPDQEVVYYWTGNIYAFLPSDPTAAPGGFALGSPILRFEGYNVARFVQGADGTQMLTREVTFYEDLAGNVVDCWRNPFTSENVSVLHVWNDPVNFEIGGVPSVELGDRVAFTSEVALTYPSPLPVADYARYSASNTYQSTELFNFYVDRRDLENGALDSVPASISWSRTGQWLPWMQMGQRPGHLIYHAQGYKLANGYADLPERVRNLVAERNPTFEHAPTQFSAPNATSWRVFRAAMQAGTYRDSCTR